MTQPQPNPIDPIIHQPTRLRMMAALAGVEQMDFKELRATLKLTDGNLSTHLTHLEKAGYLRIHKAFRGKKPHTSACLSSAGRKALTNYLAALQEIIDHANPRAEER